MEEIIKDIADKYTKGMQTPVVLKYIEVQKPIYTADDYKKILEDYFKKCYLNQ